MATMVKPKLFLRRIDPCTHQLTVDVRGNLVDTREIKRYIEAYGEEATVASAKIPIYDIPKKPEDLGKCIQITLWDYDLPQSLYDLIDKAVANRDIVTK